MRAQGTTIQQFLLAIALVAGLCWNPVHAGPLPGSKLQTVDLTAGATGTRAEIKLDGEAPFNVISLSGPDRLVIDMTGIAMDEHLQLPAGHGVVKSVRSGHPVAGTTRIVFDLSESVVAIKPHFEAGPSGTRLVIEWPGDTDGRSSAATAAIAVRQAQVQIPTATSTPDPQASRQATSQLIASLPKSTAADPTPAQARQSQADPAAILAGSSSDAAIIRESSGAVATGVPTRVATGVPATSVSSVPAATPLPSAPQPTVPQPAQPVARGSQAPVKTVQDIARRAGMRPLIIAIDAGHGGQDPGARGATGSREKDITLKIARELARQVDATPGLKAYLTRSTDVFIPLARRYQLAREHKADLFVSVHADSFTSPSASGSSVFVLSKRGASSQAARWLATQENSADLVGGVKLQDKDNTLASVLLDLSQSATQKASEDMANQVLGGLKGLGKVHKNHIERANFVVLRSPDVPSMLVETAFISNPDEERKLNDTTHQKQLATAILNGVTNYFTRQPPPGTLYAARAEAATGGSSFGGGAP